MAEADVRCLDELGLLVVRGDEGGLMLVGGPAWVEAVGDTAAVGFGRSAAVVLVALQ